MAILPEKKIQMIKRLLDFRVSKHRVSQVIHSSQLTVQKVERGTITRHAVSPREIERMKLEIQKSWSEKVHTARLNPRHFIDG